jgi:hypothetical protein
MTDGDRFFDSDGRPTASVGFHYPDEPPAKDAADDPQDALANGFRAAIAHLEQCRTDTERRATLIALFAIIHRTERAPAPLQSKRAHGLPARCMGAVPGHPTPRHLGSWRAIPLGPFPPGARHLVSDFLPTPPFCL